jgi:heme exporter protein A
VLIAQKLTKSFDRPLFSPLSFTFEPGAVGQVTGANGVGKTSLLKALAGYLSCDYEKLQWQGRNLQPMDTAFASTDERSFFPKLSLKENIEFFRKFYGSSQKPEKWLEALGLNPFLKTPFQECSTGIKKRMALLRALTKGSPILLFDEPFSNMDPDFKKHLETLLFDHPELSKGVILFSSHQPSSHSKISQRIELKPWENS